MPSAAAPAAACSACLRLIMMSSLLVRSVGKGGRRDLLLLGPELRHHRVADVRAQLAELRSFVQAFVARIREGDLDDLAYPGRARRHHDDLRGEIDRLL